VYKEFKKFIPR